MTRNFDSDFRDVVLTRPLPPSRPEISRRFRKNYLEWLSGPYNHAHAETAMWVAVITQAMVDALGKANNAEAAYHKKKATLWLIEAGPDFCRVCNLAGFDPGYVRRKVKKTLAAPRPWRAPPGKGKRYLERRAYRKRKSCEEKSDGGGFILAPPLRGSRREQMRSMQFESWGVFIGDAYPPRFASSLRD
jgi:hypothetical protein